MKESERDSVVLFSDNSDGVIGKYFILRHFTSQQTDATKDHQPIFSACWYSEEVDDYFSTLCVECAVVI